MEWTNELTKQLLAQGFTEEKFPSYIKEYNPFYGGFIYKPEYIEGVKYQTGCGLSVPGKDVIGTMSYLGCDWTHENFNPAVLCPYGKEACKYNRPLLREKSLKGFCFCMCHPATGENPQEVTMQAALAEEDIRQKKLLKEHVRRNGGHYCRNHMWFDKQAGAWVLDYKPMKCGNCKRTDSCTLLNIPLSAQMGNVYYDCRVEYTNEASIFYGVPAITIYKMIPVLKEPISMTICEQIASACSEKIIEEEFFHPYDMPSIISAQNFNVRARVCGEGREESDWAEDGVKIVYFGDMRLHSQLKKDKQKSESFSRNVKMMENYVLEHGFEELREYEKRRIRKFLGEEQIVYSLKKRSARQNGQEDLFDPL